MTGLPEYRLAPATEDEKLCIELELAARELSKHYSKTSAARARLFTRAAKRIKELTL